MGDKDLVAERYRLEALIGTGSVSEVHRATDVRLGRKVAVKLLSGVQGMPEDAETRERFAREATALTRIVHPGVVTLFDYGVHEGIPYLVMPLLEGLNLAALVQETGRLPAPVVAWVGLSVAHALQAAHDANVLHRDVKPSNIGITPEGRVVLQDFGVAKLVGTDAITRAGTSPGTPQFMAPEIIQGGHPTVAADLYGLGVCLYQTITGELPFADAVDVGAILLRAVQGVAPTHGRHGLPDELTLVVDQLCAREPADRPYSATAVAEVLAPLVHDGKAALAGLVAGQARAEAVQGIFAPPAVPPADAAAEGPEYDWTATVPPPGDHSHHHAPGFPPTLSVGVRRLVLSSMTPQNAASRLREAVNLVLRGRLQDAAQMFAVIVPVCVASLGPDHETTLTSQYWHGICLARLGAGPEAVELFAQVNKMVDRRKDGNGASPHREGHGNGGR
ncbi:protein kinase [Streptomyces pristinaespiralis]|uniref:serine/threonine-protein kinase n=1 Tax=Streptomyces pristinaespiralis TaxID=38300 RepID=UPI0037B6C04B